MAKKPRSGVIEYTAENIGAALGQLVGRLDAWKRQRAELGAELQRVMQSAQRMLSDIGSGATTATREPAVGGKRRGGRPKGYAVSPETRAKLKAAWERRRAAAGEQAGSEERRPAVKRGSRKTSSRRRRAKR